jgi:nucleotide-binding universal stress UspA family protein
LRVFRTSVGERFPAPGIGGFADGRTARARDLALMTTVLAALDNSLATNPVLVTARSLARVLGARVNAVHVAVGPEEELENAAAAAGVPLRTLTGPVVESLVAAGCADDVAAVVIGARSTRHGGRPLGSTALGVATSLPKPVVVVPPDARVAAELRCILVPLEGTRSTSLAPRSIVELARGAEIDVLALHVHAGELPDTDDDGWAREFLERYCPWGLGSVRLERRSGRTDELVPLAADEAGCDLIVMGWNRQLAPGRGPVVRAVLEHSRIPVMLVPVRPAEAERVRAGGAKEYAARGHV